VFASRADSLFGNLVADTTDEDILTPLGLLLQNQIGMIGNLSHLHNKTEDVGIIVEKDTLSNIGVELAIAVVHDTTSEIVFFLAEELTVDIDFLCGQLHGTRLIALDAPKHEAIGKNTKLAEGLLARPFVSIFLDRIEEFLVEDGDMLHHAVFAAIAFVISVSLIFKSRARALLAEVASERTNLQKSN
jgi:hypothetical protein